MVTLEEVNEYLDFNGVKLPAFIANAIIEQAGTAKECLELNYTKSEAKLLTMYLITLLAFSQSSYIISSQSAPSGASRGFQIQELGVKWNGIVGLIKSIDKKGCLDNLIPDNPAAKYSAGLWVANGKKCR